MSPLACSLFALAALIATAQGDCSVQHFGRETGTEKSLKTVEFQPPGTTFNVRDPCPPGMRVVGLHLEACNNNPNGPAPNIESTPFLPIHIWCDKNHCPYGGYIDATVYCAYFQG